MKLNFIITLLFIFLTSCALQKNKIRYVNSTNSHEGSSLTIHDPIVLENLDDDAYYTSMDLSPKWDNKGNVFIVAGTDMGQVKLWNASTLKRNKKNDPLQIIKFGTEQKPDIIHSIAWNHKNNLIAFGINPGTTKKKLKVIKIINKQNKPVLDKLLLFDKESVKILHDIEYHIIDYFMRDKEGFRHWVGVKWSPDGKILTTPFSKETKKELYLWKYNPYSNTLKHLKIENPEPEIEPDTTIAWSNNSQIFTTKQLPGISLWQVGQTKMIQSGKIRKKIGITIPVKRINRLTMDYGLVTTDEQYRKYMTFRKMKWSPDDKTIAVFGSSKYENRNQVTLITVSKEKDDRSSYELEINKHIPFENYKIVTLDWSPDNRYIACGATDQEDPLNLKIIIWDLNTDESIVIPAGPVQVRENFVLDHWSVAWSPDGKFIASASYGKTLSVWPVEFKK